MKKLMTLTGLTFVIFLSFHGATGATGATLNAQEKTPGGEVVCKEAILNNYHISLSQCSDKQKYDMNCQLKDSAYHCSCKKGETETKKETLTEKPYDITAESMDEVHQNAVAGANKICGFKLKYQP